MQGRKPFETNVPIVVGFREIGRGFSAIENFARCLNMHSISLTNLIMKLQKLMRYLP